jgi:hypothetical protein
VDRVVVWNEETGETLYDSDERGGVSVRPEHRFSPPVGVATEHVQDGDSLWVGGVSYTAGERLAIGQPVCVDKATGKLVVATRERLVR